MHIVQTGSRGVYWPLEVTPGPLPLCVAPGIEDSHQIFSAASRPHLAAEDEKSTVRTREPDSRVYMYSQELFYLFHRSQRVGMSEHDTQLIPLLKRTLKKQDRTEKKWQITWLSIQVITKYKKVWILIASQQS